MLRPAVDRFLAVSWGGFFMGRLWRVAAFCGRKKADVIFLRHLKSAAFLSAWKKYVGRSPDL